MSHRIGPSALVRGRYRSLFVTVAFWLVLDACLGYPPKTSGIEQAMHAVLAGAFTVLFLDWFGYFHSLRPFPRKSDLFLVMAAAPLAGVVGHFSFSLLTGASTGGLAMLMLCSVPFGAILFIIDYVLCRSGLMRRSPRKIVVDLTPKEGFSFLRCLAANGFAPFFELLPPSQVEQYLVESRAHEIDLVVISKDSVSSFESDDLLLRCHIAGIPFVDHLSLETDMMGKVSLHRAEPWSYLLGASPQHGVTKLFWIIKQYLEPVFALILGVALLPVMVLIALAVKYSSPGPVLYRQWRTGYLGKSFVLLKFRSMYRDSEALGPQWCAKDDSRVTTVGAFLRKTRLDELPQLFNVLRGEMSFCGPRPERPEMYLELCREIPLFSLRTVVRPGITGWAQLRQGYAASIEESREKLEYDLYYIKHLSPRLDLICIVETALMVLGLREKGVANQEGELSAPAYTNLQKSSQPLFVQTARQTQSGTT